MEPFPVEIQLPVKADELAAICREWHIGELYLYGSLLSVEARPDSDVDLLISFKDTVLPTLFEMEDLRSQFELLFERPVDLTTRSAIEQSENQHIKQQILSSAVLIYSDS